ncbi:type II toxin-antitoxin system PemK/MazF family toxin [Sphaerisporangium sp. NPDC088356]|uniref:type II toxin-antitoxin system PemK/MazF family toxin n=1 Tax=Sphaerisporangium sp. NPDC088356 TaxID=3154871 RepID=UPI003429C888
MPREAVGHEQRGERFAVLLQSDALASLSTLIIAPTSTSARPMTFRPEIELNGKTTRVLIDQLKAVDTCRLGDFAGRTLRRSRRSTKRFTSCSACSHELTGGFLRPVALDAQPFRGPRVPRRAHRSAPGSRRPA